MIVCHAINQLLSYLIDLFQGVRPLLLALHEKKKININPIPSEYKDIYIRQQMEKEQQLELQRNEQEIPSEYQEMYMRQQIEQQKYLDEYNNKEVPPEYRKLYMSDQTQRNQSQMNRMSNEKDEKYQLNPQPKETVPNEYNDIKKQQNSQKCSS